MDTYYWAVSLAALGAGACFGWVAARAWYFNAFYGHPKDGTPGHRHTHEHTHPMEGTK